MSPWARLHTMIETCSTTRGAKAKIQALSTFADLKPLLILLMNPLHTTGITATQIKAFEKKKVAFSAKLCTEPEALLSALVKRIYTGHKALEAVCQALQQYPEYRETILKLADGNLKIGMGLIQMNKAFPPGLVAEYSVALAEDFSKASDKFESSLKRGEQWFISRKIDGVRSQVFTFSSRLAVARSRSGAPFETSTSLMEQMITECVPANYVLDGEVILLVDGKENFQATVSAIKQKKEVMRQFRYSIFDCLTAEEFEAQESKAPFSDRVQRLSQVCQILCNKYPNHFVPVMQHLYSEKTMAEQHRLCKEEQGEGLMLRRDTGYVGKRSADLLKVKEFSSAEYRVIEVKTGTKTIANIPTNVMSAVRIDHKNYPVWVGSGFTDEQRLFFYQHPEHIIGQIIEVQFFEESQNKKGEWSLRFPTVKCIHGMQRTV